MAEGEYTKETIELTDEQAKARTARNWAIALSLIAFVIMLYIVTWTKLASMFLTGEQ